MASKKDVIKSVSYIRSAARIPRLHPVEALTGSAKRFLRVGEVFNTIYGLGTALFAMFGTTKAVGGLDGVNIPIEHAPLPIRLILYFVMVLGLGWTLGVMTRQSRRIVTHARFPTVALGALLLSWLVAGPVGWLFPFHGAETMRQMQSLIILLGTMAALRIAAVHFDSGFGAASIAETRIRSGAMAIFALGSAPVIILSALGIQ